MTTWLAWTQTRLIQYSQLICEWIFVWPIQMLLGYSFIPLHGRKAHMYYLVSMCTI